MKKVILNYGDLVESWKIECVVKRSRHYGLSVNDLPDIQQSLILHILNFKYDPGNAAGAEEKTALIAIIDKKIIDWLRKQDASRRAHHEYMLRRGYTYPDDDSFSYSENYLQRCDLALVINQLSEREKAVCVGILQGLSMAQIACRIRCRPQSVRHMICNIQRIFKAKGLGK